MSTPIQAAETSRCPCFDPEIEAAQKVLINYDESGAHIATLQVIKTNKKHASLPEAVDAYVLIRKTMSMNHSRDLFKEIADKLRPGESLLKATETFMQIYEAEESSSQSWTDEFNDSRSDFYLIDTFTNERCSREAVTKTFLEKLAMVGAGDTASAQQMLKAAYSPQAKQSGS